MIILRHRNIHNNIFLKAHDMTLKVLEKNNYKESDYAVENAIKLNVDTFLL